MSHVLCSAGVGRTGVFITLSIVLERMRYEGVVDIFQTVKMLRTQRPAMVQTEVNLHTATHVMQYPCLSIHTTHNSIIPLKKIQMTTHHFVEC